MPDEEKKGTENAGGTDQQDTGKKGVTADGQQDTTQGAAGNQDEVAGLKEAAKAEREKRQLAEEALRVSNEQMAILQANPVQVQAQVQQPVTTYEQAMVDVGVDKDYMSPDDTIKVMARKDQLDANKNAQTSQIAANQQFAFSHSDYSDVVGRQVGTQFVPSAELAELLQRKPHLRASVYASSEGAYQAVMDERELKKLKENQTVLDEHQKRAGIDTDTAPMGGSAAGGGGGGDIEPGLMSREQSLEIRRKLASGERV